MNNFDDRLPALRECRRVIRDGGRIALTTNLQGHMKELYEVFAAVLQAHRDDGETRVREHVAHRATVPNVDALLTAAGFTVTRVLATEQRLRFASGTAFLNHTFVKFSFLRPWKEVAEGDPRSSPRSKRA